MDGLENFKFVRHTRCDSEDCPYKDRIGYIRENIDYRYAISFELPMLFAPYEIFSSDQLEPATYEEWELDYLTRKLSE